MSEENLIYDSSKDNLGKLNSIEKGTMIIAEIDGKKIFSRPSQYSGLDNYDGTIWLAHGNHNDGINLTACAELGKIVRVYSVKKS